MELLNYVTIDYLVEVIGMFFAYAWILLMIIGWVKAIWLLVYRRFVDQSIPLWRIRIKLWHYLVLSLEFLVAKDILESIVDPNLNGLLMLGLIVVIRTVLWYFLNKEISEVKEEMEKEEEIKKEEKSKKETKVKIAKK